MVSKTIIFFCISLAVALMITSEVVARELAETSTTVDNSKKAETNDVEEAKNLDGGYGGGGYGGGGYGGGGYGGGGYGGGRGGGGWGRGGGGGGWGRGGGGGWGRGGGGGGGGGYCRYGCCGGGGYGGGGYGGGCRCCSYAGEAVDAEPQN